MVEKLRKLEKKKYESKELFQSQDKENHAERNDDSLNKNVHKTFTIVLVIKYSVTEDKVLFSSKRWSKNRDLCQKDIHKGSCKSVINTFI